MIIIVGASCSGKSTVKKILVEKYGYKDLVTYTTRPKRDGEIDGVDYHFISEEVFNQLAEGEFFAEIGHYNGWSYGSSAMSYTDDTVAVLTPSGMRQIKNSRLEQLSKKVVTFYINTSRRERLIRSLNRGDNIEEAIRRNLSDVGQFDGVQFEADVMLSGNHTIPEQLAKTINILYGGGER